MKRIFERIIRMGGFNLNELIERINFYHANGSLTDEDREELLAAARGKADPATGMNVNAEILALWEKVRELENAIRDLTGGGQPSVDDWPDFIQPTGAHDAYNTGDKISYNGKHYICKMNACVWAPDVYPAGWQEAE